MLSGSNVSNNTATIYGIDYACFPREIRELDEAVYQYYAEEEGSLSRVPDEFESADSITNLIFNGVMSGGSIPTTYLALVDEYGQIVTSDDSSLIEFTIEEAPAGSQFTSEVYGQTKFYALNGVYNISGLFLIADPNSSQSLNLNAYGIDVSIPVVDEFLDNLFGSYTQSQYVLPMQVGVRECLEGEGLRENGACYECPKGTYLLEVPTTPTE